ncbi:MAG: hypothetical protein ABI644_00755 [Arenimonas sp.]
MKKIFLPMVLILLALILSTTFLIAQGQPDFVGSWQGKWSNAGGYSYVADMQLTAAGDGSILGKIQWTLKQSPRAEEQSKLGKTGTEFISGTYDPDSRVLMFEGISKTDPDDILGLDKYKLLLADNSDVMAGITSNNGDWRSIFALTRSGKQ